MDNQDLINLLAKMGARETKADYDIGDYWNAVDEAHDALVECDAENAALKAEVEELRSGLQAIADFDPKEVVCDEFAYGRMVEAYRKAANMCLHRAAKGE